MDECYPIDDVSRSMAKEALLPKVDVAFEAARVALDSASRDYIEQLVYTRTPAQARGILKDDVLFAIWRLDHLQRIKSELALAAFEYSPDLAMQFVILEDPRARQTPSFLNYQASVMADLERRDGNEALDAFRLLSEPGVVPQGELLHAWREMTEQGRAAAEEQHEVFSRLVINGEHGPRSETDAEFRGRLEAKRWLSEDPA